MKTALPLTVLTAIAICVSVGACGGAARQDGQSANVKSLATATPPAEQSSPGKNGYVADDDDADRNDENRYHVDIDDFDLLRRGRMATASERAAIVDLVKRYIVAAAAEDSVKACGFLVGRLARGSNLVKAVPREFAPAPGSTVLLDKKCPETEALLFQLDHQRLVAEAAMVDVIDIRVVTHGAIAILAFRTTRERELRLGREGGVWKIDGLLDDELP